MVSHREARQKNTNQREPGLRGGGPHGLRQSEARSLWPEVEDKRPRWLWLGTWAEQKDQQAAEQRQVPQGGSSTVTRARNSGSRAQSAALLPTRNPEVGWRGPGTEEPPHPTSPAGAEGTLLAGHFPSSGLGHSCKLKSSMASGNPTQEG